MNINYKVIITPTAYKEINKIYDYISEDLYAEKTAKDLMLKVEESIQNLGHQSLLIKIKNEVKSF